MWRGISLANKCLLLFGAAVVLIIVAALAVAWLRMHTLVQDAQREEARGLVRGWEETARRMPGPTAEAFPYGEAIEFAGADLIILPAEMVPAWLERDPFIREAWEDLSAGEDRVEHISSRWASNILREHRYAKAIRGEDGSLQGVIVMTRDSSGVGEQLLTNTLYLFSAGLIALGLAVLVFYLITTRLILGPVRELRDTADLVRAGEIGIRSDISTGDEFEELSDTFNQMLEALEMSQDQLRAINRSLDVKLNELEERNISLHEANKLKGEFLASVSHELRTPLNSIIGFAELLLEMVDREAAAGDDSSRLAKRRRYLEHIVTAGRSLLEMINGLLEMAKVEAGKMEVRPQPLNVADACESLVAMMRPFADKNGVEVSLEAATDIPLIETDAKKFQQILYNLVSNAVKFTGDAARGAAERGGTRPARVTVRAERLVGRGGDGPEAEPRVRICVLDTGPGIAEKDLGVIFEKFRQLDSGLTRRHAGTGLGLAICKELTHLLQGEIFVESELGRGSMFSVVLPMRLDAGRAEEMRLELAFRGTLSGARRGEPTEEPGPVVAG